MKKAILNNKGFTLVEVIIASVTALVVAYFLIEITIKMVNKNNDYYVESQLLADKAIITKEIMDDFNVSTKFANSITQSGNDVIISFSDGTTKTLKIDPTNKIITYGSYVKKFNDNIKLENLTIINDTSKEMLYIKVPAYINYSDEDYGINIVLKYDSKVTNIIIPEIEEKVPIEIIYYNPDTYKVKLTQGTYQLEVWGAQGGSYNSAYASGGKGGYSIGGITLEADTNIEINVGGKGGIGGETTKSGGGYNGGGDAAFNGGGGGGASDIRIMTEGVNDTNSLYARVIVAGGGGGAYSVDNEAKANGGHGGGNRGLSGDFYYTGNTGHGGTGGSISGGGHAGTYYGEGGLRGHDGMFGEGGDTGEIYTAGSVKYSCGGAGGGGWYGGGGASNQNIFQSYGNYGIAGGGGSGWVFTEKNFTEWKNYNSEDAENYLLDEAYHLHQYIIAGSYQLEYIVKTISGDECFPSPDGETRDGCETDGYEEGHSGNGAVKITALSDEAKITTNYSIPYITGLTDIKVTKNDSYDLNEGVSCQYKGKKCEIENITKSPISSEDYEIGYIVKDDLGNSYKYTRKLTIVEPITNFKKNVPGKYYGTLTPGTYHLEVWGAQGGNYDTAGSGGKGGYSTGILELDKNTDIQIFIGEQPKGTSGGFNGGTATNGNGHGGGGASDIRLMIEDVDDTNSLYARVIVAGGGGSKGCGDSSGGYGGGFSGQTGTSGIGEYSKINGGGGGTQISGGAAHTSECYGKFGTGGTCSASGGGAGGGWYGGGHGYIGDNECTGGGGGSGWVFTKYYFENWKTKNLTEANQYLLGEAYFLNDNTANILTGEDTFKNYEGTGNEKGHSGNGAVKITKLS